MHIYIYIYTYLYIIVIYVLARICCDVLITKIKKWHTFCIFFFFFFEQMSISDLILYKKVKQTAFLNSYLANWRCHKLDDLL